MGEIDQHVDWSEGISRKFREGKEQPTIVWILLLRLRRQKWLFELIL